MTFKQDLRKSPKAVITFLVFAGLFAVTTILFVVCAVGACNSTEPLGVWWERMMVCWVALIIFWGGLQITRKFI